MRVLLRYLNAAELALFLGSQLRLRLDEAFELRKGIPSFFGHSNFPGSKFKHCKQPFPVLPEFVIPECFYRKFQARPNSTPD
jgi:hypothetical protein